MDPAERLRQELSCPICLDYFRDPVIMDCGHTFCLPCITRTWGGLTPEGLPCPLCRAVSQGAAPRPNLMLVSLVALVKQLNLNQKKRTTPAQSCPAHAEDMNIYCIEDQRALCVLCTMSFQHLSHRMLPLEQALQEGKVRQSQAYTGSTLIAPREVSCNSCLVLMTDPITPNCGHTFCRVCVAQTWVCPTCKPKPKSRLSDIMPQVYEMDEPEPQREEHDFWWSSLKNCEISKSRVQRIEKIEMNHGKSADEFNNPLNRPFSLHRSVPLTPLQKLERSYIEMNRGIFADKFKHPLNRHFSLPRSYTDAFADSGMDVTEEDTATAAKSAT